jgi:hypothetical protein
MGLHLCSLCWGGSSSGCSGSATIGLGLGKVRDACPGAIPIEHERVVGSSADPTGLFLGLFCHGARPNGHTTGEANNR